MSYTKRELVNAAYEDIGLAGYSFDIQPAQLQAALRRLDAMMAQWEGRGIRLPYTFSSTPSGASLDDDSGLPAYSIEAVYKNLAIRLLSMHGVEARQPLIKTAKEALKTVQTRTSKEPQEMRLPRTMPAGAGNKTWRTRYNPFIRQAARNPSLAPDEYIDIGE